MTIAASITASDEESVERSVDELYAPLLARLAHAGPVDDQRSALVDGAGTVWSRPGFDTVLSVSRLGFTPFDYQLATMQTVLRRMRGRAILADEVGLGKTIEAGLVLSELRMRGLADRALVITPAGLVGQWAEELERKFALPTTVATRGSWDTNGPVVLASLAAARRDPLRAALLEHRWDAVIVDEAHRLRNPASASGKLARALRTRYLLLLTATPVENRLADLYELVNLVAPGLLGTAAQFRRTHGSADTSVDALRNVAALRSRTREIMVRHRRSEVAVLLPQRLAETVVITPCEDERAVYADIPRDERIGPLGGSELLAVTGAVDRAHRVLDSAAQRRRDALSGQACDAHRREREHARTYYADQLASLERRRVTADADRAQLLAARAESTREERARRLAEIDEKYQARHDIRPFRLQAVLVPGWRVPVDVRRGPRRHPLHFDWLAPLGAFAPQCCPHCGAAATLSVSKIRLGCVECLSGAGLAAASA